MLKFLYPAIDWENIKAVGFDVDGTLYDEFDFISQVYQDIAGYLASTAAVEYTYVYERLISKWLEKGSSYPFIFSEVAEILKLKSGNIEQQCLEIFRGFKPNLQLAPRTKAILDHISEHYVTFLITDGSLQLQFAKIDSLGLTKYFHHENIFISGKHGKCAFKPSLICLNHLPFLSENYYSASEIVYFGDRNVDREFARAANFQFQAVRIMFPMEQF